MKLQLLVIFGDCDAGQFAAGLLIARSRKVQRLYSGTLLADQTPFPAIGCTGS